MLRSSRAALTSTARATSRQVSSSTTNPTLLSGRSSTSSSSSSSLLSKYNRYSIHLSIHRNANANANANHIRALSSSSSSNTNKDSNKTDSQKDPNNDALVLTPGQKVVAGTRLTLYASAFLFGSFCLYYIAKELIPTKLSPNSIFSTASSQVTNNPLVQRRFGSPIKCYGRDHGGHREGRRNFIEHTEYTDADDGSSRVRVRFNVEGKFGAAFVFCEVSSKMKSGEFVYLLVQDKRNGHVITLVDNRSRILAERMGGGSEAGQAAFGNLLGGGKN